MDRFYGRKRRRRRKWARSDVKIHAGIKEGISFSQANGASAIERRHLSHIMAHNSVGAPSIRYRALAEAFPVRD
jgi:hypothetical protein